MFRKCCPSLSQMIAHQRGDLYGIELIRLISNSSVNRLRFDTLYLRELFRTRSLSLFDPDRFGRNLGQL
jgi:hypothetical protein